MSKGFDGWQNYYFDPEYDDEVDEGEEYDGYTVEDSQRDFSYEFETMGNPGDYFEPTDDEWAHYKVTSGWEEYKPNAWQRLRSWFRWHWRHKWWNACPDCHRPRWWGDHTDCIPF
jgi:hypothetical protein